MPRYGLHILFGDIQEIDEEIAYVHEAGYVENPLDGLPDKVEATDPEGQVPDTPHVLSTLRNHDLRQTLAISEFTVIYTLRYQGEQSCYKGDLPVKCELANSKADVTVKGKPYIKCRNLSSRIHHIPAPK